MESVHGVSILESAIPFVLEMPPCYRGNRGVHRTQTPPKTLDLFPLTPDTSTKFKRAGKRVKTKSGRRTTGRHGPRPKSSPYRGVTHYKRTGRWEAHIWNKGKQVYLGASFTAVQAARAYDRAAIHFRKTAADLNFSVKDYANEFAGLKEVTDYELIKMLRQQSAGFGTLYPMYPARIALQRFAPNLLGCLVQTPLQATKARVPVWYL